jgi:hypothetical protein
MGGALRSGFQPSAFSFQANAEAGVNKLKAEGRD